MKKDFFYLMFFFITLFSACSSDLQVIGKYKETFVVYGLLDQSKAQQYIKINKAFLGEGNAYNYAQIKDSTQLNHALNVKLKRLSDGAEYILTPTDTAKNSGIFYSPDQANAIYSFNSPHGVLVTNSDYQLIIKDNETGTEVSSKTSLISDCTFTSPYPTTLAFSFIVSSIPNYHVFIKWNTGKNARLYQTIIRLNYIDSTINGNIEQHLDWVFPEQKTQFLSGGEVMSTDFFGQDFLQYIGNQLNDFSGLIARRVEKVDIISIAAGEELNIYMEVNKPSTGIIQQKPEYTNITNGLGVFSSRFYKAPFSRPLSGPTIDAIACGQFTRHLKFENSQGILCP